MFFKEIKPLHCFDLFINFGDNNNETMIPRFWSLYYYPTQELCFIVCQLIQIYSKLASNLNFTLLEMSAKSERIYPKYYLLNLALLISIIFSIKSFSSF